MRVGVAHMSWIDTALVRDTKSDLPSFQQQLRALPWPLNKTTSVDKCATAFVDGIEARKERVYCPRWVALFRWLKPVLATPFGELPIRRTAGALMTPNGRRSRRARSVHQRLQRGTTQAVVPTHQCPVACVTLLRTRNQPTNSAGT